MLLLVCGPVGIDSSIPFTDKIFGPGARIAMHLSQLQNPRCCPHAIGGEHSTLVFGGAVLDCIGTFNPLRNGTKSLGTKNPGKVRWSCGGVGRNVSEVMVRFVNEKFFCFSLLFENI
jgi:hypothetical protein